MTKKPKQKLTREELSRVRAEAARKGVEARKAVGYKGVGRKKGWTKDPALKAIPPRSLTVREPDYQVFRKFAFKKEVPIVEGMHRIAASVLRNYPELKPESWVD